MMPKSVLLVEDNLDDAFITKRILRKAGIESVRTAGDGREALQLLLASDEPLPELLILDLRLPLISGITVLADLRRVERTMALPVLILTSSEDPLDREACLREGVLAYLHKPLELPELQRIFSDR